MKIALVHDGIFCRAGGERVLLNFHKAFPEAPIYTSIYDPDSSFPEFKECDIRTTWMQKIAPTEQKYKYSFFPLGIWAMQTLNLSNYDVLLMTTTHSAKYVRTSPDSLVVAYCFTPFRLAWNPESYRLYYKSKGVTKLILKLIVNIIKTIDFKNSQRPDYYIAMTKETRERVKKAYKVTMPIAIINPSIDISNYFISKEISDYYLVVSRLEKYKMVDLVINTFNLIKKRLIIVGKGMEKNKLQNLAGPTIEFMEGVDDRKLVELYSKCKALIFPQHEDYGLTPIEAIASGRPVIAYNKGGVKETMIPYRNDSRKCTAIFFENQTSESLIKTIKEFETLEFDPKFIREHAKNFDNAIFIAKIKEFVHTAYSKHIGISSGQMI